MSNIVLLSSSVISTIIHYCWINLLKCPPKHSFIILYKTGLLTSILNHLMTNNIIRRLDRIVMINGTIVNIYYVIIFKEKIIIFYIASYSVNYLLAKLLQKYNMSYISNLFHVNTHIIGTYVNYLIGSKMVCHK